MSAERPNPSSEPKKQTSLADQFAEEMAQSGHRVVVTEYDDTTGQASQREYVTPTPPTPPSTSSSQ